MHINQDKYLKHPIKRLLVFQVKLAVDALRDIILSPVSLICTLLDSVQKKSGNDSHFEKLMVFGRNTEKRINLFEQHQGKKENEKDVSIDTILNRVESVILREYKDKHISKKTLGAIENAIKNGKKE